VPLLNLSQVSEPTPGKFIQTSRPLKNRDETPIGDAKPAFI
jgi:hypothetical protein